MSPLDALEYVRDPVDRQCARHDAAGVLAVDVDGSDGDARRRRRVARASTSRRRSSNGPACCAPPALSRLRSALVPALPHLLFGALGAGTVRRRAVGRAPARRARGGRSERRAKRRGARPSGGPRWRWRWSEPTPSRSTSARISRALLAPPLADALLDRIGEVRRALAGDIGLVLPGVRLRDDLTREPATYAIRVRDGLAGEGRLRLDRVLAVADEAILGGPRRRARARAGLRHAGDVARTAAARRRRWKRARWFSIRSRSSARTSPRSRACTLPSCSAAKNCIRCSSICGLRSRRSSRRSATDGVPLATVHRVFEALLRERVWPRDPVATLEALIDAAAQTRDAARIDRSRPPQARRRRSCGGAASRASSRWCSHPTFETELQAWLVRRHVRAASGDRAAPAQSAIAYLTTVARERAALVCTSRLAAGAGGVLRSLRRASGRIRLCRASARTRAAPGARLSAPSRRAGARC